jgi:hypothetical protein
MIAVVSAKVRNEYLRVEAQSLLDQPLLQALAVNTSLLPICSSVDIANWVWAGRRGIAFRFLSVSRILLHIV